MIAVSWILGRRVGDVLGRDWLEQSSLQPDGQSIVDRLAAIDRASPRLDRSIVEEALAEHFRLLELELQRVCWVPDAEQGYLAAYPVLGNRYASVLGAVYQAASEPVWPAALSAAEPPAERQARRAAENMGHKRVGAERNRRASESTGGLPLTESELTEPVAWSAAHVAARAALPPREEPQPATVLRCAEVCLPMVTAFEAGLFLYLFTEHTDAGHDLIAVPRPALRIFDGQLHCEDGPAVAWAEGAEYYFPPGDELPRW